jgi:hypothetical protein
VEPSGYLDETVQKFTRFAALQTPTRFPHLMRFEERACVEEPASLRECQTARLTGREPERMIEPLEMYAHVPGLLRGYGSLEQATAKLHCLDERLRTWPS